MSRNLGRASWLLSLIMKTLTKIFLILIIIFNSLFIIHNSVFAIEVDLGKITGLGPWQITPGSEGALGTAFSNLASTILGFLTALGGLATFLFLVSGALSWITSSGDKAGMEKARSQITNAVIGLIIIVAAWGIVYLIGGILGLDIINPQKLIPKLSPTYVAPTEDWSGKDTPAANMTPAERCAYEGGSWNPVKKTCDSKNMK